MRAQTRQFLTIAWTVPVRCPRSSDCQANCSTLWGRKHGSFWVQNGQCVCVRWSVLHGQWIVVGHALEPTGLECRCLRNMLDICRGCSRTPSAQFCMWCAAALVANVVHVSRSVGVNPRDVLVTTYAGDEHQYTPVVHCPTEFTFIARDISRMFRTKVRNPDGVKTLIKISVRDL